MHEASSVCNPHSYVQLARSRPYTLLDGPDTCLFTGTPTPSRTPSRTPSPSRTPTPTVTPRPFIQPAQDAHGAAHCPPGFKAQSPYSGACFHIGHKIEFKSKDESARECAQHYPGATLFAPNSYAELQWFKTQFLQPRMPAPYNQWHFWLNAEQDVTQGNRQVWVSGSATGDVDDMLDAGSGKWTYGPLPGHPCLRTEPSSDLHSAYCNTPGTATACAYRPIGCPARWTPHGTTLTCWIHLDVLPPAKSLDSWASLRSQCQGDGGELAHPTADWRGGTVGWSWLEHVVLQDFKPGAPRAGQGVAVGAAYNVQSTRWEWLDDAGTPVPAVLWAPSHPDLGIGSCAKYQNGKLYSVDCTEKGLFADGGFACVAPPPHCPDGDTVSPITGQCIKVITTTVANHADIDAACAAAVPPGSTRQAAPARVWSDLESRWWNAHVDHVLGLNGPVWTGGYISSGTLHWRDGAGAVAAFSVGVSNSNSLGLGDISGSGDGCIGTTDHTSNSLSRLSCSTPAFTACEMLGTCPPGWYRSPITGTCLQLVAGPSSLSASRSACKAVHPRAQLWSAHDPVELTLAHHVFGVSGIGSGAWVGVRANLRSGEFEWEDGADAAGLWANTAALASDGGRYGEGSLWAVDSTTGVPLAGFGGGRYAYMDAAGLFLRTTSNANTGRAFICEYIPPCDLQTAQTVGTNPTLHNFHAPSSTCVFTVPAGVHFILIKARGAGGGSHLIHTQPGGAGAYASGYIAVKGGDEFIVEVGGHRMGWNHANEAVLAVETSSAFTYTNLQGSGLGGQRSGVLDGRRLRSDVAVSYTSELLVAGGGGGGGTGKGGAGGAHDGGDGEAGLQSKSSSHFLVAYGGQGGTLATSNLAGSLQDAGFGAGGIYRGTLPRTADKCPWGVGGGRNRAGVPGCTEFRVRTSGGQGGGGHMGGGAGSAGGEGGFRAESLASVVGGGGGGTSFASDAQVQFAQLLGGWEDIPAFPTEVHRSATGGRAKLLRGHVMIQTISQQALQCPFGARYRIAQPGVHTVTSPVGALAADVRLYGAGGSPGALDVGLPSPTSSGTCLGGPGGFFYGRMETLPATKLAFEVGKPGALFASSTTLSGVNLGYGVSPNPLGDPSFSANGTKGHTIGFPIAPGGASRINRAGGGRTALWDPTRRDEIAVVGGGGGGAYGTAECSAGGSGGGILGGTAPSIGSGATAVTGGEGAWGGGPGIGGVATTPTTGNLGQGEDGDRIAGGAYDGTDCNGATCASYVPSGGDGFYGGGTGAARTSTAMTGGGGGAGFYLTDWMLTEDGHPTPVLEQMGQTVSTPQPDTYAGAPGIAGAVDVSFRCTRCVEEDSCSILDFYGERQCYPYLSDKPREFPEDVHSSCYWCDPAGPGAFMMWSQKGVGTACNDDLACTFRDNCTSNGLCQGQLYKTCLMEEWTDDPAQDCEVCDGLGGCNLAPGYTGGVKSLPGGGKTCACDIGGTLYAHGEVNPAQPECQYCDVTKDPAGWSNRPNDLACDDTDACSYDDQCVSGICMGTPYTCDAQDCHVSYTCNGDGGCDEVRYQPEDDHHCNQGRVSECRLAPTCDGTRATCPGYSAAQPLQFPYVAFGAVSSLYTTHDPQKTYSALSTQLRGASTVHAGMAVKIADFDVRCDSLTARLGLQRISTASDIASCSGFYTDGDATGTMLQCPSGYELVLGANGTFPSCIKYVSSPASWAAAQASCAAEGAWLASTALHDDVKRETVSSRCFAADMACWLGMSVQSPSTWSATQLTPLSPGDTASMLPLLNTADLTSAAPGTSFGLASGVDGFDTASLNVGVRVQPVGNALPFLCETGVRNCPPGFHLVPGADGVPRCLGTTASPVSLSGARAGCESVGGLPFAGIGLSTLETAAASRACGEAGVQCWLGLQRQVSEPAGASSWLADTGGHAVHQFPIGPLAPLDTPAGAWLVRWRDATAASNAANSASTAGMTLHATDGVVDFQSSVSANFPAMCEAPVFGCPAGHILVTLSAGEMACAFTSAATTEGDVADVQCALGGGVALPVPSQAVLHALAALCPTDISPCWTGLSDRVERGTWVSKFSPHQLGTAAQAASRWPWTADPNAVPDLDCAAMQASATAAPRLTAMDCSTPRRAVCTRPPQQCPPGHYVSVTWALDTSLAAAGVRMPTYSCVHAVTAASAALQDTLPARANPRSVWVTQLAPLVVQRARTEVAKQAPTLGFERLGQPNPLIMQMPRSLALTQGVQYKWVLDTRTVEGNAAAVCSQPFTVDVTPPVLLPDAPTASPRGGVREVDIATYQFNIQDDTADIDYTSVNVPSWQWNGFQDGESTEGGLLAYQFCRTVGTADASTCNPLDTGVPLGQWRDAEPFGVHSLPQDTMTHGQQYFVHMKATNKAGLFRVSSSDGVTFDATPPTLQKPRDGPQAGSLTPADIGGDGATNDLDFTSSTTTFTVHWSEFTEDVSPLVKYEVGLGSVLGRPVDNIAATMNVGLAREHTFTVPVAVRSGTYVYASVTATNAAGLKTTGLSDGILVDTALPDVSFSVLAAPGSAWAGYGIPALLGKPDSFNATQHAVQSVASATSMRVAITFADTDAGFSACRVAAGTDESPTAHSSFTVAQPEVSRFSLHGLLVLRQTFTVAFASPLPDATKVHMRARCLDRAGNTGLSEPVPLDIETSRPSAAAAYVNDVDATRDLDADQDGHAQPILEAVWGGFDAGQASIVSYLWGISSSAPGPGPDLSAHPLDVLSLTYVSSNTTAKTNPAAIVPAHGTTYYVVVRAVASNGLFVDVASDGVVFDGTAPEPAPGGAVRDAVPGVTGEAAFTASASEMRGSWDAFVEDVGAVAKYQYAVRWCDNGDVGSRDVRDWTDVPGATVTTLHATGLDLTSGLRYCLQIRAVNNVGNPSALLESDGVMVDTSPPVAGPVWNTLTTFVDAPYQSHKDNVSASWQWTAAPAFSAWVDEESGLTSFACCVGTSADTCDVAPFSSVGLATSCTVPAALVNAEKYYVRVRMTNGAGLSSVAPAAGVVVDSTGAVQVDGRGVLVEPEPSPVLATYTSSDKHLEVEWSVLSNTLAPPGETWTSTGDTENGTAVPHFTFQWALGTAAGVGDVKALTDVGTATHASVYGLTLTPGTQYTATVVARAGTATRVHHAHFTPDVTASAPSNVSISHAINLAASGLPEVLYVASLNTVAATWGAFGDAESDAALTTYTAALGTRPYGQQVRVFEDRYHSRNVTFTGLELVQGQEYHLSLVGLNAAGHASTTVSRVVIPDITPPLPGSVWDGESSDLTFTSTDTAYACSWSGFRDDVSPIAHYSIVLKLGSSDGAAAAGPAHVPVSSPTTHTFTFPPGSELLNQQRYTCSVTAVNAAGLSTTVHSNGAAVITSGPTGGTVWDSPHPGVDDAFTPDCSLVQASWGDFFDAAGVSKYEWCAGGAAGQCGIVPRSSVGRRTFAQARKLALQPGQAVFATVWATNVAGFVTEVSSDGIVCDNSAPDVAHDIRLQSALLGIVPVSSDRTTCGCVQEHAVFVPDFTAGGGMCVCETGYELNAVTGACEPCAGACSAGTSVPSPPTAPGTCAPGTFSHSGSCTPCPAGTFKAGTGDSLSLCLPCSVPGRGVSPALALNVSAASDSQAALAIMLHAMGSSLGGQQVLRADGSAVVLAPGADVSSIPLLVPGLGALQHGQRGYSGVALGNSAGRVSSIAVIAPAVDATPPKVQAVWDVAGLAPGALAQRVSATADAQLVAGGTATMAWLRARDAESDIVQVQCGWGSTPGAADIVPLSDANAEVGASAGNCSAALPSGTSGWVYGLLRLVSSAGLVTDTATSGFVIAGAGPANIAVRTGAQCAARLGGVAGLPSEAWSAGTQRVWGCWLVFDAEAVTASTALSHSVGLWDVQASQWLAPLRSVGSATSARWSLACSGDELCLSKPLAPGTRYEVVVHSANAAGSVSEGRSGVVQVAAEEAGVAVEAVDAAQQSMRFSADVTHVRFTWTVTSSSPLQSAFATLGHIAGATSEALGEGIPLDAATWNTSNPSPGVYVTRGAASFAGLELQHGMAVVLSVQAQTEDGRRAVGASLPVFMDAPWSPPAWSGAVAMLDGAWFGTASLHAGLAAEAVALAEAAVGGMDRVVAAALSPDLASKDSNASCGAQLQSHLVVGDSSAGLSLRLPVPMDDISGIAVHEVALIHGPLSDGSCKSGSFSFPQWHAAGETDFVQLNADATFVTLPASALAGRVTVLLMRAVNGAGQQSVYTSPLLVVDGDDARVRDQSPQPGAPSIPVPVVSATWAPPVQRWVQGGSRDIAFRLPLVSAVSVPLQGMAWTLLAVSPVGEELAAQGSVASHELLQVASASEGLLQSVSLDAALAAAQGFRVQVAVSKTGGGLLQLSSPTVRLVRSHPLPGTLALLPDAQTCGTTTAASVPAAALQEALPWTRTFRVSSLAASACAPRKLQASALPAGSAAHITADQLAEAVAQAGSDLPFIVPMSHVEVSLANWADAGAGFSSLTLTVGATALGSQAMPHMREVGSWDAVRSSTSWTDLGQVESGRLAQVALNSSALEGGDSLWLTAVATNFAGLSTAVIAPLGVLDVTAPALTPRIFMPRGGHALLPAPGSSRAEAAAAACAVQTMSDLELASFMTVESVQAGLVLRLEDLGDAQSGLASAALSVLVVPGQWNGSDPVQLSSDPLRIGSGLVDESCTLSAISQASSKALDSGAVLALQGGLCSCASSATPHPLSVPATLALAPSPNTLTLAVPPVPWGHADRLFPVAQVANGAGSQQLVLGQPVLLDGTAPTWSDEVEVRDGGDVDADCILGSPGAVFQASWTPAADAESGIVQYEWCIGSTGSDAGRDDIMPCRLVGDSLEASELVTGPDQADDGFTWPSGGTLFVSVRAQNGAGTWGAWITSDGARALCDAAQDASCVVEDVRGVLCVAL